MGDTMSLKVTKGFRSDLKQKIICPFALVEHFLNKIKDKSENCDCLSKLNADSPHSKTSVKKAL